MSTGVGLVIGTWNFPVTLTLGPLVGAIAAGCPALIKPAEQTPATATLMAELLPKYLDKTAYRAVLGAVEETTALLKLKFDMIFYTGSGAIGKIILRAAAEHLCPVILELGGKSPCLVLDDADINIAARRIMWSKYTNAGVSFSRRRRTRQPAADLSLSSHSKSVSLPTTFSAPRRPHPSSSRLARRPSKPSTPPTPTSSPPTTTLTSSRINTTDGSRSCSTRRRARSSSAERGTRRRRRLRSRWSRE